MDLLSQHFRSRGNLLIVITEDRLIEFDANATGLSIFFLIYSFKSAARIGGGNRQSRAHREKEIELRKRRR